MFNRTARLATAAAVTAALGLSAAPAVALTASEYTVMIADFERTYGKDYVALGSQQARNRCIVPDEQQKTLNPALYDQQVKERLACETFMTKLVAEIRKDSAWTLAMDNALTVLGENYSFLPAIQLRAERRAAHIDSFRQQRWSVDMEKALGDLSKRDSDAKFVLDLARKVNRTRVETATWSPTVEQVLAPMVPYDSAAETMLKKKRADYLAQWQGKAWSPMMEQALAPMVKQFGLADARALLEAKRRAVLNAWINKDYSADMDAALSELAPYYPPAASVLAEKKLAASTPAKPTATTTKPAAPATTTPNTPATTTPGSVEPSDLTPAPGGSSDNSTSDEPGTSSLDGGGIAGIIAGVLALLGIAGTALYFAWFGI